MHQIQAITFFKSHTKLGILTHHDKIQLQDKGHNSESHSFGVIPFVNLEILSKLHIKLSKIST